MTPSRFPSSQPTDSPTMIPSGSPSVTPSLTPSSLPSSSPTTTPTNMPSASPSLSQLPSSLPSGIPSTNPTNVPSLSQRPSSLPSVQPTVSQAPSTSPSLSPSSMPSHLPSQAPTDIPSRSPSSAPTSSPTQMPSDSPSISQLPSSQPSESPTASPSDVPTLSQQPSSVPSVQPTVSQAPSSDPSAIPTSMPSISPTQTPSQSPSDSPSSVPTTSPTGVPSASPSESTQPSEVPSSMPSESPSESIQPSDMPSPEFGDVNVTVPNRIEYVENGDFDISSFVDYVDRIPRSDEELFLEIDLTGAPDGTEIILNGVNLADDPNNFDGEWLLIPAAVDLTSLRIRNFEYFSGTFNLTVRGTLRENGLVVSNSTEEIVTAEVIPVATCIGRSVAVRVPEDAGNITWGADYFTDTSFRAEDYAQNSGNNIVPEFFIEIQITIPAPQLNITSPFDITVQDDLFRSVPSDPTSTTPGIGSATISLDETSGNKVYTIRSTLLPNGTIATEADILALTDLELAQLEDDLRSTASSLVLSISPEHTDADGSIIVGATTVDVNICSGRGGVTAAVSGIR